MYNDKALCGLFYKGLKPDVKTAIITQGRASNLPALIAQAINIDQHQYQLRMEERRTPARQTPNIRTTGGSETTHVPSRTNPPPTSRPPTLGPSIPWSRTPRLGPLSLEEQDRCLKEGLCFRCREKGHRSDECPKALEHQNVVSYASSDVPPTDSISQPQLSTPGYNPSYPDSVVSENWQSQGPLGSDL